MEGEEVGKHWNFWKNIMLESFNKSKKHIPGEEICPGYKQDEVTDSVHSMGLCQHRFIFSNMSLNL